MMSQSETNMKNVYNIDLCEGVTVQLSAKAVDTLHSELTALYNDHYQEIADQL